MQEPAYPIFFPTFTLADQDYVQDWWWYDPGVISADVGPFPQREEAVSDWAWEHLCTELLAELHDLDTVLGSPLLAPPEIVQPGISRAMPDLRRAQLQRQWLVEQSCGLVAELLPANALAEVIA